MLDVRALLALGHFPSLARCLYYPRMIEKLHLFFKSEPLTKKEKRMSAGTVERLDVIAIGPHPDDLEITCGGTLAKLVRQGYKVGMIDLTSGEPTPRGSEEIRTRY